MKKTVKVEDLKNQVNDMLLNSEDDYKQGRESLCTFIERVLMDAGNYHGFGYLSKLDMQKSSYGTSVGIVYDDNNNPIFENTDHTRVHYY